MRFRVMLGLAASFFVLVGADVLGRAAEADPTGVAAMVRTGLALVVLIGAAAWLVVALAGGRRGVEWGGR